MVFQHNIVLFYTDYFSPTNQQGQCDLYQIGLVCHTVGDCKTVYYYGNKKIQRAHKHDDIRDSENVHHPGN